LHSDSSQSIGESSGLAACDDEERSPQVVAMTTR
jgi:hypothetical protein